MSAVETITGFLTEDHRYADDLFAAAAEHGARREWPACGQKLDAFRAALETHMKIEEEVLFPAFERATGTDSGPTAVMRIEHRQMLETLHLMSAAKTAGDGERFDTLVQDFSHVMEMHSAKEERVLYPMCDRMVETLSGDALREKLRQLRSAPVTS